MTWADTAVRKYVGVASHRLSLEAESLDAARRPLSRHARANAHPPRAAAALQMSPAVDAFTFARAPSRLHRSASAPGPMDPIPSIVRPAASARAQARRAASLPVRPRLRPHALDIAPSGDLSDCGSSRGGSTVDLTALDADGSREAAVCSRSLGARIGAALASTVGGAGAGAALCEADVGVGAEAGSKGGGPAGELVDAVDSMEVRRMLTLACHLQSVPQCPSLQYSEACCPSQPCPPCPSVREEAAQLGRCRGAGQ